MHQQCVPGEHIVRASFRTVSSRLALAAPTARVRHSVQPDHRRRRDRGCNLHRRQVSNYPCHISEGVVRLNDQDTVDLASGASAAAFLDTTRTGGHPPASFKRQWSCTEP